MATYTTIHTTYGLRRMSAAEAAGVPINLMDMAVGDGGGNAVSPDPEQTQLVRERFRAKVNRIYQNHDNPNLFTGELLVPVDMAGFTMREVGIFDADGGLFAVANLPATYKPAMEEGSYSDAVVRMEFMVSNASVVILKIDPNIAVATQSWVINNLTPAVLLPGGTTGQVARKRSNSDGDIEWSDVTNVNVVVETLEETQTLVANQVTIDLQYLTTKGLAIYIAANGYNGERLPKEPGVNGWQPDPNDDTRVLLGRAYAGAKAICVQNEPVGSLDQPLAREQNLADLVNVATARKNLDVYSKSEADASGQPGDIKYTVRSTAPTGWLKANGAAISRLAFPELFAVIGETYGKGDGFNTFNLPDLRGEFIRGWDNGRGLDKDRVLGSTQVSANLAHSHTGTTDTDGSHNHTYVDGRPVPPPGDPGLQNGSSFRGIWESLDQKTTGTAGSHWHALTIKESGGTEARPHNVALLACIKY
jgi:phage-related tail fiber protein